MKSRMVEWGAVGVLLAGVAIGVYSFNAASVKGVTFPEIIRAMEKTPWTHASATGYGLSIPALREFWIGFDAKVLADRMPDGKVSFCSLEELQMTEYDPNNRTITRCHMEEQEFSPRMLSPLLSLGNMQETLTSCGGKTAVRMGRYREREVQVQQTWFSVQGRRVTRYVMKLYVDPQSKLLQAVQVVARDAAGAIVTAGQIAFDYPQSGPQNIYDLGVPLEARIVNNMPADDWRTVRERYRKIRAEATKEYIAVVAHQDSDLGDSVTMIDVDYKSGSMQRQERHLVFGEGKPFDQFGPAYRELPGESFESLLAWTRKHYDGQGCIWIRLCAPPYGCSLYRSSDGIWSRGVDSPPEGGGLDPLTALADLAWPDISSEAGIIVDDYSRENNLICVETLTQGQVTNGTVLPPIRHLYYLDPQRDYICCRRVTEWCSGAAWQEDTGSLGGIEPDKVGNGSIIVHEITEAFQAANGHWYPEMIVEQSRGIYKDPRNAPPNRHVVKRIHLALSPEFVESTFDISSLPG